MRAGDFEALLTVLDPDVVLRTSTAGGVRAVHGAKAVASGAVTFQRLALVARPVLVNGARGVVAVDADGALSNRSRRSRSSTTGSWRSTS